MKKEERERIASELQARIARVGRPKASKLNIIVLDHNGKGRGYIVPLGDIHWGAKTCNENKVIETIKYCYDNNIHVVGMGDWLECGLSDSVGDSVYTSHLNPQEQFEEVIEMMTPLVRKGLLSGLTEGNHENRISKRVGIDITKMMARILDVSYFSAGQFHLVRCGKQSYTMFTTHGSSGSRLPWTKIRSVMDVFRHVTAEVICMGHLHGLDSHTSIIRTVDKRTKTVVKMRRLGILTGHFLEYEGSYAEMKNMIPSKTGVVKIAFHANEHKVIASI